MKIDWIKGLSKEETEKMKNYYENSFFLLDKLKQIIYTFMQEEEKSLNDYDSPSWPYRAADYQGRRAAYKKILALLPETK